MSNSNWTLYYDGGCPMCVNLARGLSRLDFFHKVTWAPYQSLDSAPKGMTWKDFEGAAQLDTGTGGFVEGYHAFRCLTTRVLPLMPLAPICWLPGIDRIAEAFYRRIAKKRRRTTSCVGCLKAPE